MGYATHHQHLSHDVYVPVANFAIPLGPFWYVLLFLIIAGAVNGVNLTDGLDGLAAGTSIIALSTFTAMAVTIYIRSSTAHHGRIENRLDVAFIGAALIGAAVGFLWFNAFPAEVFMGDTGAMAMGGAIAAMAIMLKVELLLLFVGGIFAIEALSVMLQVISFKWWGRRIFLIAPLAPSLRDEGLVRDEDHGALLDPHGDLVRGGLRALLQVLPPVPRAQLKALVYGLARSGRSATERLRERGDEVVQVDRSLGNEDELSLLEGVELARQVAGRPRRRTARRPGSHARHSRVVRGRARSELSSQATRIVGVTGTNGKTTTVELLGAIFRAAGRDVAVAGNVGTPLTSIRNAEWVVCELSSFQLEDVHELACDVAVLLNLEPDHLDRHGSFEAYRDAKLRIFERARAKVVPRGSGSRVSSSRPPTSCRPSR